MKVEWDQELSSSKKDKNTIKRWKLLAVVSIHWHCREKSSLYILINIFFCVPRKKGKFSQLWQYFDFWPNFYFIGCDIHLCAKYYSYHRYFSTQLGRSPKSCMYNHVCIINTTSCPNWRKRKDCFIQHNILSIILLWLLF